MNFRFLRIAGIFFALPRRQGAAGSLKQYIRNCLNPVFAGLLLAAGGLALASQDEVSHYQSKLEKLYQSIDKVKKHLKSRRHKRGNVLTELHRLETEIGENSRKLQKTGKKSRQLQQRARKLKQQLQRLDRKLGQQQAALAELFRAAYMLGAQQQLKMLLNQEDPASLSRIQQYFDYLNRARTRQIAAFEQSIRDKQRLQADIESTLATLQTTLASQRAQKKRLNQQRRSRAALLVRLEQEIQQQELTLSDLEDSRNRIENLLKSLGELLADIPPGPGDQLRFASLRGKLPRPVAGRLVAAFGQPKQQGGLKWNGVLIASGYGEPVKAVSYGRVAFADWLQGFGFITIIDHGNGYMTLYGHNESLFKQAGDWVEAGEVIATVGDSGGHDRPGLYFEIRERGKPVNPARWFGG